MRSLRPKLSKWAFLHKLDFAKFIRFKTRSREICDNVAAEVAPYSLPAISITKSGVWVKVQRFFRCKFFYLFKDPGILTTAELRRKKWSPDMSREGWVRCGARDQMVPVADMKQALVDNVLSLWPSLCRLHCQRKVPNSLNKYPRSAVSIERLNLWIDHRLGDEGVMNIRGISWHHFQEQLLSFCGPRHLCFQW